jgi:hypothetical protein
VVEKKDDDPEAEGIFSAKIHFVLLRGWRAFGDNRKEVLHQRISLNLNEKL